MGWLQETMRKHVAAVGVMAQQDKQRERVGAGREGFMRQTGVQSEDGRPELQPARPNLNDEQHAEYERVAASVGFAPSGLEADKLRRFLSDAGIGVYDRAKVAKYLDGIYGVAKRDERSGVVATWVWRPMRTADSAHSADLRNELQRMVWQVQHSSNGDIAREQAPYAKAIPLPALLTVEKIVTQFPTARFYVSDEYHAPPVLDPFLAVEYGGELFVIERWDEPSFRG